MPDATSLTILVLIVTWILMTILLIRQANREVERVRADYARELQAHEAHRRSLLAIQKDLIDRLTAKDLSGYTMLQKMSNGHETPEVPRGSSDADEYRREMLRKGLGRVADEILAEERGVTE